MAMVVAACASVPRSPTDPPPPAQVAARWVAEDGTVVAVNLVVAPGTNREEQRTFAERERSQHPGARVIIRIFAATAGPERYVVGHVPAGTEPLVRASPSETLLGIYDFMP